MRRDGNDLLVELEHQPGILTDSVRVRDHFLSREAGIEEIAFANGIVWDRAKIEARLRAKWFDAGEDTVQGGREDEPLRIEGSGVFVNDSGDGPAGLTLISVGNGRNGTATLNSDGSITFLGAKDFNGKAYFSYTVRDQFGRESTADVEVQLAPVNDAPVARDDSRADGTRYTVK